MRRPQSYLPYLFPLSAVSNAPLDGRLANPTDILCMTSSQYGVVLRCGSDSAAYVALLGPRLSRDAVCSVAPLNRPSGAVVRGPTDDDRELQPPSVCGRARERPGHGPRTSGYGLEATGNGRRIGVEEDGVAGFGGSGEL